MFVCSKYPVKYLPWFKKHACLLKPVTYTLSTFQKGYNSVQKYHIKSPQVCDQEVSTYILGDGGRRSINHKKSILYVAKGAHSTLFHIKTWHSSRNGWNLFLWIGSLLTNSFSGEGNGQMLSRCIPLERFPVWESENYCTCSIIKGSQRNTIAP